MSDSGSDILKELGDMKIGFNKKRHSEKLVSCSVCGKKVRKDYLTKHKRRTICRPVKRTRAKYLQEKVKCECGKMIRRDGLSSHKKRCKSKKPKKSAITPVLRQSNKKRVNKKKKNK